MTMRQIGKYQQLRAYHLGYPVNLWVLRNFEKYDRMDSKDLYREYERQMIAARGAAQMQVVK